MTAEIPTEHPHITRNSSICGGSPRIRDSRITVRHIAEMWKGGDSVEEIIKTYPHIKRSWVYDAISYYLDHQQEIEEEIEDNQIENVLAQYGGVVDEKGVIHLPGENITDAP